MSTIIALKRTSGSTNNQPRLPQPADIEFGELVINYKQGLETIAFKNSNNEIVTFRNNYVTGVTMNGVPVIVSGKTAYINGVEVNTNKVTSISSASTDTQYPSAKCVYDKLGDIDTALTHILSGGTQS